MPDTASRPGMLEQDAHRLSAVGDWTLPHYARLREAVAKVHQAESIDLQRLGELDTSGAALLVDLLGPEGVHDIAQWAPQLSPERQALLRVVADATRRPLYPPTAPRSGLTAALARLGQVVELLARQQLRLVAFIGLTLTTLLATLVTPRRWRITSLAAQVQQSGLNAIPIVALLTFLVGAVVAFLGATVLRDFGATIYTVNLVAYAFLREFGVLLAAILLAGRTASAFTAQIGAMKANEELDALRAQGLDPVQLLVLPRVLAMVVSLPILALIGTLSGMLGGALVCAMALDISTTQFLTILQRDIPLSHFAVGIGKAPLFAFVIAVIGCLEGFKAGASAQSVGEHTTSSVVQSIFMVILLDALAALFFMEMGW
ncbi:MlaE family ABC transporter permease [Billgrantia lactosivorans]|uniref:MlaE family ABC transporter permease n=1 Tax=Billgrantia lactosivorans TaxID=2185141 RepID=UPI000DADC748|nr:ABC transporter permease [Halomonas lactosivorans]